MLRIRSLFAQLLKCFCVPAVIFAAVIMPIPTAYLGATLPTNPDVVSGTADVATSGSQMTVTTSDNAIINWASFSIGDGFATDFAQPGSASAVLNRVTGGSMSDIQGALTSNGQVFVINPNGILVGADATIDTAGFLASTLDIADADFLDGGDLTFTGSSDAAIVNLGAITATAGDIFLIARKIDNAGSLSATSGTVGLAAGSEVLLSASGDQRIFVQAGIGIEGEDGLTNSGAIEAMSAELAARGNLYSLAINNTGSIAATGVAEQGGRIMLTAQNGTLATSGDISAAESDGMNGEINLAATNLTLSGRVTTGAEGALQIVKLSPSFDLDTQGFSTGDILPDADGEPDVVIQASASAANEIAVGTITTALNNNTNVSVLAENSISVNTDIVDNGSNSGMLSFDDISDDGLTLNLNADLDLANAPTGEVTDLVVNLPGGSSGDVDSALFAGGTGNVTVTGNDLTVTSGQANPWLTFANVTYDAVEDVTIAGDNDNTIISSAGYDLTIKSGDQVTDSNTGDVKISFTGGGDLLIESNAVSLNAGGDISTETGNISITGSAGGTAPGVDIFSNFTISTTTGSIDIDGSSLDNDGVEMWAPIETETGAITITGTTGSGSKADIVLIGGISSTGTGAGDIMINGATELDSNVTALDSNITFSSPVLLLTDVTVDSGTGNATFNNTINANGSNRSLTVNSSGITTFGGIVGGSDPLESLTTNAGGTTAVNAAITVDGDITFGDTPTLGSAAITFGNDNTGTNTFTSAGIAGTGMSSVSGGSGTDDIIQLTSGNNLIVIDNTGAGGLAANVTHANVESFIGDGDDTIERDALTGTGSGGGPATWNLDADLTSIGSTSTVKITSHGKTLGIAGFSTINGASRNGGLGQDIFNLAGISEITINGRGNDSDNPDTINIASAAGDHTVTIDATTPTSGTITSPAALNYTGIESLVGGTADTLSGADDVTAWVLNTTATADGVSFSGFGTLDTGGGADTFTIANGQDRTEDIIVNDANTGSASFAVATGETADLSGIITGAGAVNITGDGTLEFSGVNTYTGVTNINDGTLNVTGQIGTVGPAGTVTIASGATLEAGGTINAPISGGVGSTITATADVDLGDDGSSGFSTDGTLNIGSHTVTLKDSSTATLGPLTTINGGELASGTVLSMSSGDQLTGNGTISGRLALNSGTVTVDGNMTINADTASFGNTGTLNVGSHTVTLTSSGAIELPANITIAGGELASAQTLSMDDGDEEISGSGLVNAVASIQSGSLVADGGTLSVGDASSNSGVSSTAGGATFTVTASTDKLELLDADGVTLPTDTNLNGGVIESANGMTLPASAFEEVGTLIANTVTVPSGGSISPAGTSNGILNITGNLAFEEGSTAVFDIDGVTTPGNDYDQITVTDTLTLATTGSGVSLTINDDGGAEGDSFTLFDVTSTNAVSGTFAGFAGDGEVDANFNGTNFAAYIGYVAGDGNDVVVNVATDDPVTLPTPSGAIEVQIVDGVVQYLDGGVVVYSAPLSSVDQLTINGNAAADDTLEIETSDFPSGFVINYDGGVGGNDSLTVTSAGAVTLTTIGFDNATDGDIDVDGVVINFFGLEPVLVDADAGVADIVFNLPNGGNTVLLSDDANPSDGISQIAPVGSATFETTAFTHPTGTLTINGGTGIDLFELDALDDTNVAFNITINGGADDNTFNIDALTATGTYTFDGNGGTNTLDLADLSDAATIALANAGTTTGFDGTITGGGAFAGITGLSFDDVTNLTGTSVDDTLTGINAAAVWTASAGTYESTNTLTFTSIENWTGNANVDTFTIDAAITADLLGGNGADDFNIGAALTGTIDAGAGNDTIDLTAAAGSVSGTVSGGSDSDTLTVTNATTFNLTGADAAAVTGFTSGVSNIETFTGSANADTFVIDETTDATFNAGDGIDDIDLTAGNFTGEINAGAGNDDIDISGTGVLDTGGVINGDAGDDNLGVAAGAHTGTFNGGDGNDTLDINGNSTTFADFNGDADSDTLNVAGVTDNVITSLTTTDGTASTDATGTSLVGVENVIAGGGTDQVTGTTSADTFTTASPTTFTARGITFTGIDTINGGDGGDTFNINHAITLDLNGDGGEDDFVIGASGDLGGTIVGGTASDTIDITALTNRQVFLSDATDGSIDSVVTAFEEIDVITAAAGGTDIVTGLATADTFDFSGANQFSSSNITFNEFDQIDSGDGNDTITIDVATAVIINGGDGDDDFDVSAAFTGTINGNDGDDDLNVTAGASTGTFNGGADNDTADIDGGTFAQIIGEDGTDTLQGDLIDAVAVTSSDANGFTGTETAVPGGFSGIDTITLNGGTFTGDDVASTFDLDGTPTYNDGSNTLNISGFATLQGGSAIDDFNVTANTVADINGGDGNDIFDLSAELDGGILGQNGDDTLNLLSGGSLTGAFNGQSGTDTATFTAATTVDTTAASAASATNTGGLQQIEEISGGANADTFTIDQNDTAITFNGGDGADEFTVTANFTGTINAGGDADILNIDSGTSTGTFNGDAGDDSIDIDGGTFANINGDGDSASINIEGLSNQSVTITAANAGTIDGPNTTFSGVDTITAATGGTDIVDGLATADTFDFDGANAFTSSGIAFAGFDQIDGNAGADTFTIDEATSVTINGGAGIDTFTVTAAYGGTIDGGSEADVLHVDSGTSTGTFNGGSGDDSIDIDGGSFATINGQANNASIDIQGISDIAVTVTSANAGSITSVVTTFTGIDQITAADAGDDTLTTTSGVDVFNAVGADSFSIQGITFDDIDTINAGDGADTFTMDEALDVVFNGQGDADVITVTAAFPGTINGGAGADVLNVDSGASTGTFNGDADDDVIDIDGGSFANIAGGADNASIDISGAAANETVVLTGANAGTITGIIGTGFSGIDTIASDAGSDDTIEGTSGADTFSTTGATTLTAQGITFTNFNNLDGAGDADIFNINNSTALDISGGAGADVVNLAASITLTGDINGDADADEIDFADGATLTGSIDGGAGTDVIDALDYATAVNFAATAAGTTDGLQGTISIITGTFDNINDVQTSTASGGTFTAIDGAVGTFDLDADPVYTSGAVTLDLTGFTVITGGSQDDVFNVDLSGGAIFGGGDITINGGDGDDVFNYDFSNAGILSNGQEITFNGQGNTGVGDAIGTGNADGLQGDFGGTSTITHTFTNNTDGSILLSDGTNAATITYTGLEPIFDNISPTNRVFTFSGANDVISVTDVGANNDGDSNIDSDVGGESVTFTNPTDSMTINAGAGTDTINVESLDTTGSFDLIINGDADADTINLDSGLPTFALVTLTAETIDLSDNAASTITSTEAQTYDATTINLREDTILNAGAAEIDFVGGDVQGAFDLTFTTTGAVDVNGTIGAGGNDPTNVTVSATATSADFTGAIEISGDLAITATTTTFQAGAAAGGTFTVDGDDLNLAAATYSGVGGVDMDVNTGIDLTGADASTTTITGTGAGDVVLAAITDTNNPNLTINSTQAVSLDTVTMGSGTLTINADTDDNSTTGSTAAAIQVGTLTVNGGTDGSDDFVFSSTVETTSGAITITDTDDLSFQGNVTAETDLTAIDVDTDIDIDDGVELTAEAGSVSMGTDVTGITLNGNVVIDQDGDAGAITLSAVTGTDDNLTLEAEGSITTAAIDLGNGTLNIDLDNGGADGNEALSAGQLDAGTITVDGVGGNDTMDFNGTVITDTAGITIATGSTITFDNTVTAATALSVTDATTIALNGSFTMTATNGAIDMDTSVGAIDIVGNDSVTIDGNGDALVNLTAITDTATGNLTVNSEGGVNIDSAALAGTLTAAVDNNNDSTSTGTFGGTLSASAIDIDGGTDQDETLNFADTLTSTTGSIDINNAATVDFADSADANAANGLNITNIATEIELGQNSDLTATAGNIDLSTGNTLIDLNGGAAGTNNITATAGSIDAIDISDTAEVTELAISAGTSIDLDAVDLDVGTPTLDINVDTGATGNDLSVSGLIEAGTIEVDGTGTGDDLTFGDAAADTVTSTDGSITISNADEVNILGDMTAATGITIQAVDNQIDIADGAALDANGGNVDLDNTVALIDFSGNASDDTINATGDIELAGIIDSNGINSLTIEAGGSVSLDSITIDGDLDVDVDDAAEDGAGSADTLTADGAISAAVITIDGRDADDTLTFNADVTASSTLDINTALSVELASGIELNADGELDVQTSVTGISLLGAGTITIDGDGDADVLLTAISDAATANLTIESEGSIDVSGAINMDGNGTLTATVDNDAGDTNAATMVFDQAVTAGVIDVQGVDGDNDNDITFTGAVTAATGDFTADDFGTLTFSSTLTATAGDILIDDGDTIDIDGDAEATAGAITISNIATEVLLGTDVDLTAGGGNLAVEDGVTEIEIDGAGSNTLSATDDIDLTDIVDSADVTTLAITSGNDIDVDAITLDSPDAAGAGDLDIDFDGDNADSTFAASDAITAGSVTISGTTAGDDTATFAGTVAATGGAATDDVIIEFVNSVEIGADVNVTSSSGDIDIDTNIGSITLTGAGSNTFDAALSLSLEDIGDTAAITTLTLESGTDMNLDDVIVDQAGTTTLDINVDTDADDAATLDVDGDITAGSITIDGQGTNDTITFDGDSATDLIQATSVGIAINTFNQVTFSEEYDMLSQNGIVINAINTEIELGTGVDITATTGNIDLENGVTLIDLAGTDSTNDITATAGAITLNDVTDSGTITEFEINAGLGADVDLITLDGNTTNLLDINISTAGGDDTLNAAEAILAGTITVNGTGTGDTLNFADTVESTGTSITIGNADTVDFDGNVTAETTLTITDVATDVDLAGDVDITAENGSILIVTDVADITLSGAGGTTNVLNQDGDTGQIDLTDITGADADLEIDSDGNINLDAVTLTNGSLDIDLDADSVADGEVEVLDVDGAIQADALDILGQADDDIMNFASTIETTGTAILIVGAETVDFDADVIAETSITITDVNTDVDLADGVDLTAEAGSVLITTNVNEITLSGDGTTPSIITQVDDSGEVDLAPVSGTEADLEIDSDGDITLSTVSLGNGTFDIDLDVNDSAAETLDATGTITVASLTANGFSDDDIFNFGFAVETTVGAIDIDSADTVDFDADVIAETSFEITNVTTDVDLAANVDITAEAGSLTMGQTVDDNDDVTIINLSGTGRNILTATGANSDIVLTDVDDTAAGTVNLTLDAGNDVDLDTVTLDAPDADNAGILNIDFDQQAGGSALTAVDDSDTITVGTLTIDGDGGAADDTAEFHADILTTANGAGDTGDIIMRDLLSVTLAADVDLTSDHGDIDIDTGEVGSIILSEAGSHVITADEDVFLTDISDSAAIVELEINSGQDMSLDDVIVDDSGTTLLDINVDAGAVVTDTANNVDAQLVVDGDLTAGEVTIDGQSDDDDMLFQGDDAADAITAQNAGGAGVAINSAARVDFSDNYDISSATTVDITNVTTEVELGTNADITASDGDLNIPVASVQEIDLDGVAGSGGTNILTATTGNVILTRIVDQNGVDELQIVADQDITIESIDLDAGTQTRIVNIDLDFDDDGDQTLTLAAVLEGGAIDIDGTDATNDVALFNGPVTANRGAGTGITIDDIADIDFLDDVSSQSVITIDDVGTDVQFGANADVFADGDIDINADTVIFITDGTAADTDVDTDSDGTVTITITDNAGNLTIGADIDFDIDGRFLEDSETNGGGADVQVNLGGDIVTSNDSIEFESQVALTDGQTILLDTSTNIAGGANITFRDTVDSEDALDAGRESLTMDAGSAGSILFADDAAIGSLTGQTQELGDIVITAANNVTFNNTVDADSIVQIVGFGTTRFDDPVVLDDGLDDDDTGMQIAARNIFFDSDNATDGSVTTQNGGIVTLMIGLATGEAGVLTMSGAGDDAGADFIIDGAFTQAVAPTASGVVNIGADLVTTADDISFASPINLTTAGDDTEDDDGTDGDGTAEIFISTNNDQLAASVSQAFNAGSTAGDNDRALGGDITFTGTINGAQQLVIDAGTGAIDFGDETDDAFASDEALGGTTPLLDLRIFTAADLTLPNITTDQGFGPSAPVLGNVRIGLPDDPNDGGNHPNIYDATTGLPEDQATGQGLVVNTNVGLGGGDTIENTSPSSLTLLGNIIASGDSLVGGDIILAADGPLDFSGQTLDASTQLGGIASGRVALVGDPITLGNIDMSNLNVANPQNLLIDFQTNAGNPVVLGPEVTFISGGADIRITADQQIDYEGARLDATSDLAGDGDISIVSTDNSININAPFFVPGDVTLTLDTDDGDDGVLGGTDGGDITVNFTIKAQDDDNSLFLDIDADGAIALNSGLIETNGGNVRLEAETGITKDVTIRTAGGDLLIGDFDLSGTFGAVQFRDGAVFTSGGDFILDEGNGGGAFADSVTISDDGVFTAGGLAEVRAVNAVTFSGSGRLRADEGGVIVQSTDGTVTLGGDPAGTLVAVDADIDVDGDVIILTGEIRSSGDGDIDLLADNGAVSILNDGTIRAEGGFVDVESQGATGPGITVNGADGSIVTETADVTLTADSDIVILKDVRTISDGGDVSITATGSTLRIGGAGQTTQTEVSTNVGPAGQGGSVTLDADTIEIGGGLAGNFSDPILIAARGANGLLDIDSQAAGGITVRGGTADDARVVLLGEDDTQITANGAGNILFVGGLGDEAYVAVTNTSQNSSVIDLDAAGSNIAFVNQTAGAFIGVDGRIGTENGGRTSVALDAANITLPNGIDMGSTVGTGDLTITATGALSLGSSSQGALIESGLGDVTLTADNTSTAFIGVESTGGAVLIGAGGADFARVGFNEPSNISGGTFAVTVTGATGIDITSGMTFGENVDATFTASNAAGDIDISGLGFIQGAFNTDILLDATDDISVLGTRRVLRGDANSITLIGDAITLERAIQVGGDTDITFDAATAINISSTTFAGSIQTAAGDIILDADTTITVDGADTALRSATGDITLIADSDISISSITSVTGTTGDVEITADADNSGGGNLTIDEDIITNGGSVSLAAGAVGETNGNTVTLTGMNVATLGGDIEITAEGALALGGLATSGNATLIATDAAITQDGSRLDIDGDFTTTSGTLTLTGTDNNFVGLSVTTTTGAAAVTVDGALTLESVVDVETDLTVIAGGDINVDATTLAVGGNIAVTTTTASDVILNGAIADFDGGSDTISVTGGSLIWENASVASGDINFLNLDLNGDLVITGATDAIVDDAASTGIVVDGEMILESTGAITLNDTDNTFDMLSVTAPTGSFVTTSSLTLKSVDVTGDLGLTAGGLIQQSSLGTVFNVLGTLTLNSNGNGVRLTNPNGGNTLDTVDLVTAGNVVIATQTEGDTLTLLGAGAGDIASLTVSAFGDVDASAGITVANNIVIDAIGGTVVNPTNLTSTNGTITLNGVLQP